jgi:hypothetical protein
MSARNLVKDKISRIFKSLTSDTAPRDSGCLQLRKSSAQQVLRAGKHAASLHLGFLQMGECEGAGWKYRELGKVQVYECRILTLGCARSQLSLGV